VCNALQYGSVLEACRERVAIGPMMMHSGVLTAL